MLRLGQKCNFMNVHRVLKTTSLNTTSGLQLNLSSECEGQKRLRDEGAPLKVRDGNDEF